MGSDAAIRLIVNADDFGISQSANRAILRAHREGILTTTSLMVNGDAAAEAIQLAHAHPRLGVGLHLTFVKGRATLPPSRLDGLTDAQGAFTENPVGAGMRYFFSRGLHPAIAREVEAQFQAFRKSELPLDHVNGHLHFHLHPTLFAVLKTQATAWGIRQMRLTREPLGLNLKISRGNYLYRLSHAFIFECLARYAAPAFAARNIRHTDRVFGLLENDRITESYLLQLLERLKPGTYEVYAHPDEDAHAHELEALCSPRVAALVRQRQIQLIRYTDL